MFVFLIFVAVVVLALIVIVALKQQGGGDLGGKFGFPYAAAPHLFSAAERSFLGVLDQAVGPEHRVFGKVRVADVASVKGGLGNSARQGALNRIAGKHFDFIVCRVTDLAIVCAVELNDSSHGSSRAQKRDEFLSTLCKTVGLPLLQIPARSSYQLTDINRQFELAVGRLAEADPAARA